jgi:hypothetical protein
MFIISSSLVESFLKTFQHIIILHFIPKQSTEASFIFEWVTIYHLKFDANKIWQAAIFKGTRFAVCGPGIKNINHGHVQTRTDSALSSVFKPVLITRTYLFPTYLLTSLGKECISCTLAKKMIV